MKALTPDETVGLRRLRDLRVIDVRDTEFGTKMYHGLIERGLAKIVDSWPGYVRLQLADGAL